ncbi:MAG: hypothetical protein IKL65_02640 [Bacilli bacterium]|nr:hypothetical protein [Bacilli bacterium]
MKNYANKFIKDFIDYTNDINSFYNNLNGTNFKGISVERLSELKLISQQLNAEFNNKNLAHCKSMRYGKIANKLKTNPKRYTITSDAEKYILFMFSVDPDFEAVKIYGTYNTIEEIKKEMSNYFGIFDKRLVLIENFFIKHFLSEKKRNEIKEEIEKRAFK